MTLHPFLISYTNLNYGYSCIVQWSSHPDNNGAQYHPPTEPEDQARAVGLGYRIYFSYSARSLSLRSACDLAAV